MALACKTLMSKKSSVTHPLFKKYVDFKVFLKIQYFTILYICGEGKYYITLAFIFIFTFYFTFA